jgi:hypothetical protein
VTDENRRWSDEELSKFHSEFLLHQEHEQKVQETLKDAVDSNTKMVKEIHCNTRDMLAAWDTVVKGVTFFSTIGKFVKWAAGVIAAAGIIWYTFRNGGPSPR